MIDLIVTGHGNFASGMLSAIKLIAGEKENVHGVDFPESDSTADLKEKLLNAINSAKGEVLIAADLAGGSPYNTSVTLMAECKDKKIKVFSGTNLALLLSVLFADEESTLEEVAETVLEEGKDAVSEFKFASVSNNEADEDGI